MGKSHPKPPQLRTCRIQNFKAIRNTKTIRFAPLTVLIGQNGSGKSSLLEAMETYQAVVLGGLEAGFQKWGSFQNVWNQAVPHEPIQSEKEDQTRFEAYLSNPMSYSFSADFDESLVLNKGQIRWNMIATTDPSEDPAHQLRGNPFLLGEEIYSKDNHLYRSMKWRELRNPGSRKSHSHSGRDDVSMINELEFATRSTEAVYKFVRDWQFVSLIPSLMEKSYSAITVEENVRLEKDGSNVTKYLWEIQERHPDAFNGIVDIMKYVLSYLKNLQVDLTKEITRSAYLKMTEKNLKTEKNFQFLGSLLSTGTLRILAILALLNHPTPPPLIFIEEIENGLDPRSVHLIIGEIRDAVEEGKTQVIATTHSPYLLNLLNLSEVVLVERDETGQPVFWRPKGHTETESWAKDFAPGDLYKMNILRLPKEEK